MNVIQADALEWCKDNTRCHRGIITSLPELSEVKLTEDEYLKFLRQSAKSVLECITDKGYAIFIQTDRKKRGWIDKSYYITDEAYKAGFRMMWHKIALIKRVDVTDQYKPTYSHCLCFSKKGTSAPSTPDVIHRGQILYKNGLGLDAVSMCLSFLKSHHITTVIDPFVGKGSVLRVAKQMGFTGIGIDIDPEQCERTRFLLALTD